MIMRMVGTLHMNDVWGVSDFERPHSLLGGIR